MQQFRQRALPALGTGRAVPVVHGVAVMSLPVSRTEPCPRPPISVVIPTWNALRYLPACLAALRSQLTAEDELILVDNASRDQASAWARQHAPDVRLICLPTNLGFAGGTNVGIRAARHPLLLLCNDDALVEPGCVVALVAALHTHPDCGAVAGVLTFSRHPERVASAGIRMQQDGLALDTWIGYAVDTLPRQPQPVFGASGGLALLRRAMLDDVGLFAESFFAYLEDADLAWRMRLRGWRAYTAPISAGPPRLRCEWQPIQATLARPQPHSHAGAGSPHAAAVGALGGDPALRYVGIGLCHAHAPASDDTGAARCPA